MTDIVLLLITLTTLALVMVMQRKIRLIHIASYELTDKIRDISTESRQLYGQIQAYIELKTLLGLDKPLPALRGWAASPDFLLEIARQVLLSKPQTVLECSSGASTIVLARCLQMCGSGHVHSLEHDPKYAQITRDNLAYHGLEDWASVLDAPLVELDAISGYRWYSPASFDHLQDIDLIVVDGPPCTTNQYARYPTLPMLKGKVAKTAKIYLDDANRSDENEILKRWCNEDPDLLLKHLDLEKGGALLTRYLQPVADL